MEQTEQGKKTDESVSVTGLTPEQIAEYQSRFRATPGSVIDFQLFRVVPPKGPAQPLPAQVPVGSTNDLKEAIDLADRLNDNTTILICKREWYAKTDEGWSLAQIGQEIKLKEPTKDDCPNDEETCEEKPCCKVDSDGSSGDLPDGSSSDDSDRGESD